MIKMRYGIFETNSSSSHSFVFKKYLPEDEKNYNRNIDDIRNALDEDTLTLPVDGNYCEFGWGFDVIDSPREKLEYVLTAYHDDTESCSEKADKIVLEKLSKIMDINGIDWKKAELDDDCYDYTYGYIDHQSYGLLQEFIKEYDISLVDFIFDSRYVIFIDNDNSDRAMFNLLGEYSNGALIGGYYDSKDEYDKKIWEEMKAGKRP